MISFITTLSYRHIWVPSSVVYIHEGSDRSHCDTYRHLDTDHMACYSHCRSSVGNILYIKKIDLTLDKKQNMYVSFVSYF